MANQQENAQIFSIKCGLSSFMATFVAGVLHPLQLIKTRFQSHDGKADSENLVPKYKGARNAVTQIYTKEGFKGLYKGFWVSFASNATASALFFLIYERRKYKLEQKGMQKMKSVTYASIQASVIATLATQPFWVIRTRMLLNTEPNTNQYQNLRNRMAQIYAQNGFRGYLKGVSLSILLSFSGVCQMYLYEGSRTLYDYFQIPQTYMQQKNFICGGFSKVIAVLITYPLTTMRTRIQQNQFFNNRTQEKYSSISKVILRTIKDQGVWGFYKGVMLNLARGIPQRGIYFYCYQIFKELMGANSPKQAQQG